MYTYSHNVKEKETEFGHASVPGEKKKNKHMLVVSDTSFCSNNLKNVCFIFKTKFRWHSLDAAVETVSLFLERIKKHLHDRVTPVQQHRKCLCLCTQFALWEDTGEFFNAYILGVSYPHGHRSFGISELQRGYTNYPVMRYMAAQHCSNQDPSLMEHNGFSQRVLVT